MSTKVIQKNNLSIRHILYGNAVFSGLSGIIFTLASRQISAFLGLDAQWVILDLGLMMIGYAALLYFTAARTSISRGFVLFTVIADSVWVAASILLLLTGWVPFSVAGKWTVGITAMIVDIFATLQFIEWRKM